MKFFLNPGHCKDYVNGRMLDSGAINKYFNIQEAVIADKIGKELKFYLESAGHDVYYLQSDNLRNNKFDDSLDYPCIVEEANYYNPDFAISIHLNAFNSVAKGTQTMVFRRGSIAEQLGKYIQESVVDAMDTYDRGLTYEEDKEKNKRLSFIMLTNVPAVLIECCFIDNNEDAELLLTDEGIKGFAKAIFEGIDNYIYYEV